MAHQGAGPPSSLSPQGGGPAGAVIDAAAEGGAPIARLVLLLACAGFASSVALRSVDPLVGVLARDLASDAHTVALLSSATALPYALIQPVLGPVGDAWGKERVLVGCLAALCAALAGCALVAGLVPLFALRILAGAAAGGCIPLSLAMLGDRVPLERRQVAISRFLVAVILGQLMGSTIAGLIEAWIGWRGVFALTAGVAALGLAAVAIGFGRACTAPPAPFALDRALDRYRAILATPRARVLFACVFVEGIALFGLFPYIAPLLDAREGAGPREAGLVLAGFAVGGLLYSALVPVMLRVLGIRWMLVAGGAVCALALLTVAASGLWPIDCAALLGLGTGFYMLHNTFQTQVTEVAPAARGSAVALHAFSYFCGQALSVAVFGALLERLGRVPALALCAGAILALGLAASARLTRRAD